VTQMDLLKPAAPPTPAAALVPARPTDPDAGPRQTVEQWRHPTHGECTGVHRNGPAYLRAADGARVPLLSVSPMGGGKRPDGTSSRYRYVRGEDGARVQVDLLTRGEDHRRMSSPLLGLGWLIYPTEWRDPLRWEGDDGKRLPFDVVTYQAGDAAYIAESARVEKSRKRDKVWPQLEGEAARWMRLTMRDGTSMDFRRDQP